MVLTYLLYPITARELRRSKLVVSIDLLSKYHAIVHLIIKARLRAAEGDLNDKHSCGRVLTHAKSYV